MVLSELMQLLSASRPKVLPGDRNVQSSLEKLGERGEGHVLKCHPTETIYMKDKF